VAGSTKDRILDAAIDEFAVVGFNGTTTRAICLRAGVNGAALNYHWGSKERLWLATCQWAGQPTAPDPADVVTAGTWDGWGTCGVRCCDGSLVTYRSRGPGECRASWPICVTHGKTLRMRFQGDLLYRRQASC
jgi:Bacterial regulatory proteins, tetR family